MPTGKYTTYEIGDQVDLLVDFQYMVGKIVFIATLDHLDYPLYVIEVQIGDELTHEVRSGFESDGLTRA